MQSQILVEYIKESPKLRFNQCDIVRDISIVSQNDLDENQQAIIIKTNLDYALVINQDCDLEQDFNNKAKVTADSHDKFLPTIIFLPAYIAARFRSGTHRGNEIKAMNWNSDKWKEIKSNQNPRFHHIQPNETFQLPELVIDFKHLYAMNRDLAYKSLPSIYFLSFAEVYRENISQRYTSYLGRIGLPDNIAE